MSEPREKSAGAGDLHVRSGDLRSGIEYDLHRDGLKSKARIGVGGVKYAAIHELGGTIRPKKSGGFLKFVGRNGEDVFVREVTMPARPYIRPSVMDRQRQIEAAFAKQFRRTFAAAAPRPSNAGGGFHDYSKQVIAAMDKATEAALLEVAIDVTAQAKVNVSTPGRTND